jgi:hypothetical protein
MVDVSLDVSVSPDADANAIIAKLTSEHAGACQSLEKSLAQCGTKGLVRKQKFMTWAELMVPQLSSTLSTFVHNLLFHSKYLHHHLNFVPFKYPKLDQTSSIFQGAHCSNLFALAVTSPLMGGKWHNLYSFEFHGHSMNRLQVCLIALLFLLSVPTSYIYFILSNLVCYHWILRTVCHCH